MVEWLRAKFVFCDERNWLNIDKADFLFPN